MLNPTCEVSSVPWYGYLILLCVIIGPFDALYMYIKSEKRREALRKKREEAAQQDDERKGNHRGNAPR